MAERPLAVLIWDSDSVSPGHALVIPRRHFDDWFEVTPEELADCAALVKVAKTLVEASYNPDGYNVGVNIGVAAGQTVSLDQPLLAAYVPYAGAPPIGPFTISLPGLGMLNDFILPPPPQREFIPASQGHPVPNRDRREAPPWADEIRAWAPAVGDRVRLWDGVDGTVVELLPDGYVMVQRDVTWIRDVVPPNDREQLVVAVLDKAAP